ncbi:MULTISPECIES: iron chaperone [Luteimonas]|uniref:iron chaperone n=1 Tax=Luteimonas TaxID=83614 RepID=UPI000C799ADD|nr:MULTISPECIES: DUF1801 domain-containing protein [Luteimonas]
MNKKTDHDTYIDAAPEQFRDVLRRLRAQLALALPDAQEVVKYDMPGFEVDGTVVAGYAAFSRQCGLYVDPAAIAACALEISDAKLKATKTGVTFPANRPIPHGLVTQLATRSRDAKGI